MSVSVIIPAYRSEDSLEPLLDQLEPVLTSLNTEYEVIIVNDGSPDSCWEVVCRLSETRPWVHGISLMRNYGQHNALLCGIRKARFDVIVTMDDDLQHRPEDIPVLLAKLEDASVDIVYGAPKDQRHGFFRDMASQMTKLILQTVMGVDTARHVSAFRAFRSEVRRAFADYQNAYVSIDVLLTWATTRFAVVFVEHQPRDQGQSGYTFRKLFTHAVNLLTGFSALPLRLASFVGFIFTLFGGGVLAYVLGRYLIQGSVVPGFAFLASAIAIFSGSQLFALGIIGEYLARIHTRSMDKPLYAIREEIHNMASEQECRK